MTSATPAIEDAPTAGCIVVPVGGGGQITGIGLAVASFCPSVLVVGVEPELADDATRSFETRHLPRLDSDPQTVAEGVKSRSIGERNFDVIVRRRLVSDMVTVSEREIVEAVWLAWRALRRLLRRVPRGTREKPTVLVLSGGNFEPGQMARILTGGER